MKYLKYFEDEHEPFYEMTLDMFWKIYLNNFKYIYRHVPSQNISDEEIFNNFRKNIVRILIGKEADISVNGGKRLKGEITDLWVRYQVKPLKWKDAIIRAKVRIKLTGTEPYQKENPHITRWKVVDNDIPIRIYGIPTDDLEKALIKIQNTTKFDL